MSTSIISSRRMASYDKPMKLFLRAWDLVARSDGVYYSWAVMTPNFLCWLRLFGSPAVFALVVGEYWGHQPSAAAWALLLVVPLILTDLFDGTLARHMHATSARGALLDPLADKVLEAAGGVAAVAITQHSQAAWLTYALYLAAAMMIASEIPLALIALMEKRVSDQPRLDDMAPRAELWGKTKFHFYAGGIMLCLLGPVWSWYPHGANLAIIAPMAIVVGFAFGMASIVSHVSHYGTLKVVEQMQRTTELLRP